MFKTKLPEEYRSHGWCGIFFAFLGITSFWILFLSQNGCHFGRLAYWKVFFMPPVSFVKFLLEC